MNEKFTSPECETIIFDNEDVITISLGGDIVDLPGVGE
jgi:hypothetical protein